MFVLLPDREQAGENSKKYRRNKESGKFKSGVEFFCSTQTKNVENKARKRRIERPARKK